MAKTTKSKAAPKKAAKKTAKVTGKTAITKKVVAESLLKVGQKAPSFKLKNESGETISLKDFAGKKLVIYFYPKDDTPGCTKESCDFRDQFSQLKKNGVSVIGVSKDSIASHLKFKTKYYLPFTLLSDEEGQMCEAYGVWKEKSMYGRKYMGIERTTFLIDESGKVSKIYPKVSVTFIVKELKIPKYSIMI